MIEDLAENDKEKFATFWKEFGRVIKEGVVEDYANRERIAKVLRFASTHTDTEAQDVSLADYIVAHEARAGKNLLRHCRNFCRGQEQPASRSVPQKGRGSAADARPRRRMGDAAFAPSSKARNCSRWRKAGWNWASSKTKPRRKRRKKKKASPNRLLERIKKSLGESVKDVRVTLRLTDSPACLVSG